MSIEELHEKLMIGTATREEFQEYLRRRRDQIHEMLQNSGEKVYVD